MEKLNKKDLSAKLEEAGVRLPKNGFVFLNKTASAFDTDAELAVAKSQTAGKGRLGRDFFSPVGGIYFCLKVSPAPLLTLSVAAGVMRALEAEGFSPRVKWVNDILLGGKKVCGILCKQSEGEGGSYAVAGVGINFCVKRFPDSLKDKAGCLFGVTKGINRLAALTIKEVLAACQRDKARENLLFYRSRLLGAGQEIALPDGSHAVMTGIDDDGSLVYFKDGKEGRLFYGDICL